MRSWQLPSWPQALVAGPSLLFVAIIGLPVFAILARVAQSEAPLQTLTRPIVLEALRVSAITTACTLAGALLLGTPLAYVLARRRFPGHALLDSLLELPMVLPPAVAGVGLLFAFGRRGLLGDQLAAAGISIPFTATAVVLAQFFVAAPFYVRAARAAFESVDPEFEIVSHTLGVSSWLTFVRVTVPLAFPGLLSGATTCWARALGEFGATIMFAGSFLGRTQTLPLAIYAGLESDLDAAMAISALLTVLSFGLLLILRASLRARNPVYA
ncbi:MAG: molybdate ABC transporter permease subunit [Chloroflexi bacterium]|nr:molybdate ABC transporter permease subunit [Chloroflexota bacterium]